MCNSLPTLMTAKRCRWRSAAHEVMPLATDDRKARRIAGQLALPTVQLVSTSQIVSHWAGTTSAPQDELRRLLAAIELRARFIPPHDDPLREWWICNRSEAE